MFNPCRKYVSLFFPFSAAADFYPHFLKLLGEGEKRY